MADNKDNKSKLSQALGTALVKKGNGSESAGRGLAAAPAKSAAPRTASSIF